MSKILGKVVGNTAATPIRIPKVNNVLKAHVSGCPLILTDVSPIEHEMMVTEDVGATAIVRCGKNLLDVFGRTKGKLSGYENTTQRTFEFDKYYIGLSANNYYNAPYVTADLANDTWTITSTMAGYGVAFPVPVTPNTRYSCNASTSGTVSVALYDWDGAFIKSQSSSSSFVTPENCCVAVVCYAPPTKNEAYQYSEGQLEFGATKTEYEPYVEPIEYEHMDNAEIIKIPSLYPTTVLYEAGGGGIVTAEYNRDINKVISNLENALLSIGGNV